ncbi:hypothetical protein OH76DRAFT_1409047 [Lentinus brumalis]|uniref:Uncharacterized protein n=1 Tax=Lentinus brumalis TaxID=2498619 RepID=A0A371CW02_9APHY|nr:hypothetical protein OH76DRAFT_1409047 [Polyporus brumalis]
MRGSKSTLPRSSIQSDFGGPLKLCRMLIVTQILLVGLNPGRAKHTTLLTISAELPVLEGTTAALYHPGKLGIIGPMPVLVKPNIVDCRLPNMHLSIRTRQQHTPFGRNYGASRYAFTEACEASAGMGRGRQIFRVAMESSLDSLTPGWLLH